MKRVALFFLLLLFLAACKEKGSVPGNILPPPKMQAVMWDMMRADQFLSDYVLNKDLTKNKDVESVKMYERIFGFHKINQDEFKKSFAYYRTHPLLLKNLMDSIQNRKIVADTLAKSKPVDSTAKKDTPQSIKPVTDSNRIHKKIKALPIN